MKLFLKNIFDIIDGPYIDSFYQSVTKFLPSTGDIYKKLIWGNTESGFWYSRNNEVYFYENTGAIHALLPDTGIEHYQIITGLYSKGVAEQKNFLVKPITCDEMLIDVDNHPSGFLKDTKLLYIVFQPESSEVGIPLTMDYCFNNIEDSLEKDYIDACKWIFSSLYTLNYKFPSSPLSPMNTLRVDNARLFYLFPKFDSDINSCIDMHLSSLETFLNKEGILGLPENIDILNYAREQWLPLKI